MRFLIAAISFLHFSLTVNAINTDSLVRYYSDKAQRLLVGHPQLNEYFSIGNEGVSIYARPEDKLTKTSEFFVGWSELDAFRTTVATRPQHRFIPYMILKRKFKAEGKTLHWVSTSTVGFNQFHPPLLPLAGIRIAIDPGHIAHDTVKGRLEQKFISIKLPHGKDSVRVAFAEGQLTWLTAEVLADHLKRKGAEVMITRSAMENTAFGRTYEQWKEWDSGRSLDSLISAFPDNQIYKDLKAGKMKEERSYFRYVFRDVEIRRRAIEIGNFHPDFTVVIHYNVDETNSPWNKPTQRNFSMLFVPGAFQAGELSEQESRIDFLRLLLTDEIERSVTGAGYLAESFQRELHVPLAGVKDAAYLGTSCKATEKTGVYCRNLSMTRLIHGPVLYGETLYQDNITELRLLSASTVRDSVSGIEAPARVLDVVRAYEKGLDNWLLATSAGSKN
jgi:N-acetylmuramoyl-L-alanine amidase